MEEVLLSDVVAVLVGGCVDKGGDLLVALLFLDHIDNVLKLGLLGDLLTDRPVQHNTHLKEGWCTKFHKVFTFDDEINPLSCFLYLQHL